MVQRLRGLQHRGNAKESLRASQIKQSSLKGFKSNSDRPITSNNNICNYIYLKIKTESPQKATEIWTERNSGVSKLNFKQNARNENGLENENQTMNERVRNGVTKGS